MIIGDLHIPYEDKLAVNVMLKIHQHVKPETVIINGDLLDFIELSTFTRDKLEDRPIGQSIHDATDIIKKLQRYSTVIYHIGNHELRLKKYLLNNAPEIKDLINFNDLINNDLKTEIEFVEMIGRDSMQSYFDGKLLVGHFNRVSRYSAYTCKLLCEDYKISVVQGHTHRLGSYYTTGMNDILQGHESGCLCNLHPGYTATPNWQNGLLMAYTAQNIETVFINNGEALYRGKCYKG